MSTSATITQQTARALTIAKRAGMTAYLYVAQADNAPPELQEALRFLSANGYLVVDHNHNIVGHCMLNRPAKAGEPNPPPKLRLVVNNG